MSRDDSAIEANRSRQEPPLVAWTVVESTVDDRQESQIFSYIGNFYPTREEAEREAEARREAKERVEEDRGEELYDLWDVSVQKIHLSKHRLEKLAQMDEEEHQTFMDAAAAVSEALLRSVE